MVKYSYNDHLSDFITPSQKPTYDREGRAMGKTYPYCARCGKPGLSTTCDCTDGPTGLPAAQELLPCPFCGGPASIERGSDHHGEWFNLGCAKHWGAVKDKGARCIGGRLFYTAPLEDMADAIAAWNRRAPQAAAPGGVAPTPSLDLAELREALERDDDDRTTADWNLIDRWARAALVIIPSHDVWRTALLRIADEHKVYKGHGDHDIVPACSAEEAQSLARTALRNGEPA